jgi:hypothetical protein
MNIGLPSFVICPKSKIKINSFFLEYQAHRPGPIQSLWSGIRPFTGITNILQATFSNISVFAILLCAYSLVLEKEFSVHELQMSLKLTNAVNFTSIFWVVFCAFMWSLFGFTILFWQMKLARKIAIFLRRFYIQKCFAHFEFEFFGKRNFAKKLAACKMFV